MRRPSALLLTILPLAALAALAAACDGTPPPATSAAPVVTAASATPVGDPAVWYLGTGQKLSDSATGFVASVHRQGCNNGVTGEVLAPTIHRSTTEVVVTFTVDPIGLEPKPCQGNEPVSYQVDLGEPLGNRSLVDGQCLLRPLDRDCVVRPGR